MWSVRSRCNIWSTTFYGITPEYFEVRNWTIAAGKSFEPADMTGAGKVVLLGTALMGLVFLSDRSGYDDAASGQDKRP